MLKERLTGLNTMLTRKEVFYFIKNKITDIFNHIEGHYHPIIHVIGDSHSAVFLGQKFFRAHPIGPVPAASLGLSVESSPSKQKLINIIRNADRRSIFVTVFGDHDCRLYLYQQFKENEEKVPLRELIRRIVVDYCKTLNQLKKINKKIIALSIPGASYQKNIYNLQYYAPQKLQAQIYHEYNELLEEECRKMGITFVNTYKYLADERGITRKEYLKDELHLNTRYLPFFMQELNSLLN